MANNISELNTIHLKNLATPNRKYYGDDGKIYIGTKQGRLRLLEKADVQPINPIGNLDAKTTQNALQELNTNINDNTSLINDISSQINEKYIAGENISGNKLLVLINNMVYLMDPSVESNYSRIVGFSQQSAVINQQLVVTRRGELSGFALTANNIYYALSNGDITSTIPTSGIVVKVGVAKTYNTLDINIEQPVITI